MSIPCELCFHHCRLDEEQTGAFWALLPPTDAVNIGFYSGLVPHLVGDLETVYRLADAAREAFTVSMAAVEQMTACDYVGIELGNIVANKAEKAGWHTTRSEFVDAPLIDELPMAVECRLIRYDPESCRLVGEIINVSADESVLDTDWKIDPDKLQPITSTAPTASWARRWATPFRTGSS